MTHHTDLQALPELKKLIDAIRTLRSPEGCPWDREQTHKSLKKYLLNESYELLDAIDSDIPEDICEELGDVLLQVVLHAQIASEKEQYNIENVAKTITDKLIYRHPHVFSNATVKNADEVVYNWEQLKNKEKTDRTSILDGVPNAAPALIRASGFSKKAVGAGFEWPDEQMLWDTFYSEINEFKEAIPTNNKEKLEEEMGDILFTLTNLARWHKLDPELALQKANKKFKARFQLMEKNAEKHLSEYSQPELEELWQKSKEILNKVNYDQ